MFVQCEPKMTRERIRLRLPTGVDDIFKFMFMSSERGRFFLINANEMGDPAVEQTMTLIYIYSRAVSTKCCMVAYIG